MPIDFSNLFNNLQNSVARIVDTNLKDYAFAANEDAQSMLNALKYDLKDWSNAYSEGSITKEDLEYLIVAQQDIFEMITLRQAGIAEITANQFKSDILHCIITTITLGV